MIQNFYFLVSEICRNVTNFEKKIPKLKQNVNFAYTFIVLRFSVIEPKSQKRNPVMRSLSDRRDKDSQEVFNFKDTTALRKKTQRTIPSHLFQKPNNSLSTTACEKFVINYKVKEFIYFLLMDLNHYRH